MNKTKYNTGIGTILFLAIAALLVILAGSGAVLTGVIGGDAQTTQDTKVGGNTSRNAGVLQGGKCVGSYDDEDPVEIFFGGTLLRDFGDGGLFTDNGYSFIVRTAFPDENEEVNVLHVRNGYVDPGVTYGWSSVWEKEDENIVIANSLNITGVDYSGMTIQEANILEKATRNFYETVPYGSFTCSDWSINDAMFTWPADYRVMTTAEVMAEN